MFVFILMLDKFPKGNLKKKSSKEDCQCKLREKKNKQEFCCDFLPVGQFSRKHRGVW